MIEITATEKVHEYTCPLRPTVARWATVDDDSEVVVKRLSGDRSILVTWHASGRLFAWEQGTAETHRIVRPTGWARIDTHNPPRGSWAFAGDQVGAFFEHEVVSRRRAYAAIYSLFPEVLARSVKSTGWIHCRLPPDQVKRLYEADLAAKKRGTSPPADALEGAGAPPTSDQARGR